MFYLRSAIIGLILGIIIILIPYVSINNELQTYYDEFMEVTNYYCKPDQYFIPGQMIVKFAKLEAPTIGLCEISNFRFVVSIDSDFWRVSNSVDRKSVVFHELSHCILGLDHSIDKTNYMYSDLQDTTEEELADQLINNLVEKCIL